MHVKSKIADKAMLKYFIAEDTIFHGLGIISKANVSYSGRIASNHKA